MRKYLIATAVAVSMATMQVLADTPPASTSKLAPTAQAQQPAPSSPQQSTAVDPVDLAKLGTVQFPTSGSPEAQTHFLRGMVALHSFWYPVALAEFRQSTKLDPDFMMGYWGEAMAHNHPIWGDPQDIEAARKVLEKIRITPELTERERAYLQAVQVLYGKADKASRDRAYAAAMEKIHRDYPNGRPCFSMRSRSSESPIMTERPVCAQEPSPLRSSEKSPITPARRITSFTPTMIPSTPVRRSTPHAAMPRSLPPCRTPSTCPRTSSCNWGCGERRPPRTRRPWGPRESKARVP